MGDTLTLLKEHRMQEALDALRPLFADGAHQEHVGEYTDICITYRYMLDYFRQGSNDPQRERVFTQLAGRLLLLSDRMELEQQLCTPAGFGNPTLWTVADAADATLALRSATVGVTDKCLLLSNMLLSNMQVFDPLKVPVLCEATASPSYEVAVRAVTALSLLLRCHADRLPFYPDAVARIRQLSADSAFIDMLADVELQLSRCLDTERIERQMRDEIIPAMLRSPMNPYRHDAGTDDAPHDEKKSSTFADDISINPDWEEWMEKSGIGEKMRELTEMQLDGADVYMATFANMKSFPFFNEMENWFRPFDATHPAVCELFHDTEQTSPTLQRFVMQSDTFCNSDKYSFCLSLNLLPASQRDLLRNQMNEQAEALRDDAPTLQEALARKQGKPSTRTLTRQYLQDLYRFFHLCPQRVRFHNPFDSTFVHSTLCHIAHMLKLPFGTLCALAELDIQRKDYADAGICYFLIHNQYPEKIDATMWQKLGYCRQMNGKYGAAIEALTIADMLQPDHLWTQHHLAQCYRKTGRDDKALEYYTYIAKRKPDDLRILWQQAQLLMKRWHEADALPLLQRLAYEQPETSCVLSLLAEAHLKLGNISGAVKQSNKLMELPRQGIPCNELYAPACAYWLDGQRNEALTLFQQILKEECFDEKRVHSLGIPETDIPYLRDLALSLQFT